MLTPERHAQIFGPQQEDRHQGRSRLCKVCGGWHALDRPWPHNCRPERRPPPKLAAPMVTKPFEPFVSIATEKPEMIGDRRDRREYMRRHDLVDYEAGVDHRNEWVEEQDRQREIATDIKRTVEMDPAERPPIERVGETDLNEASEVDVTAAEVIQ